MKTLQIISLVAGLSLSALIGCEQSPPTPVVTTPAPATTSVQLPTSFFASTEPADAVALIDIKTSAKPGDQVVFYARIGGRKKPFIENRAVFAVADASLVPCEQEDGEGCQTPWDYCCEGSDSLLKHMATIQIVDDAGQPLKLSLLSEHGLEPLKTIFVSGTVHQIDESGVFVVNADSIYVQES
ncbi:MAG: hypothetical protein O7G85_16335 [Planctomycetota bacterium]|nr:hypothetical protein [Planctomycetota bacterium]